MLNKRVSICIPTFQSESFIDFTISCARAQTYQDIKIIISVDRSSDGTIEICQKHAREDNRVIVIIQQERLGWSQNANATLDQVDTDYFFLYFHDDIIKPTYVETLLDALGKRPDAASAHCDLIEFGLIEELKKAYTYDGNAIKRLIDFMTYQKGTTLRSLIKRNANFNHLRFPKNLGNHHWPAYIFHMKLLAEGPAIGVHKPLYYRWQREGSLTRSENWNPQNIDSCLLYQDDIYKLCTDIFSKVAESRSELILSQYSLSLFFQIFIRTQQLRLKHKNLIDIPKRSDLEKKCGMPSIDSEILGWINIAENKLSQLEKKIFGNNI